MREFDIKQNHNHLTPLTNEEINKLLMRYKNLDFNLSEIKMINEKQLPKSTKEKIKELTRGIDEASAQVEEIFHYIRRKDEIPIKEVMSEIVPIIEQASEIPHVYYLFKELQEKDDYTYRHNICVAVISAMLGKWLGYSDEQLREIELAGLFHDIGKTKVPLYLLHKHAKLTASEVNEMNKHTIYGYKLIQNTTHLSDAVALAALQHHERMDGRGYPLQLRQEQIHPYARIINVADVFHALSSERVYKKASSFYQVITHMNDTLQGRFDPVVIITFLHKMTELLVGKSVQLSNGQTGTIVMNNQYRPLRSVIKMEDGSIIDLQQQPDLHIEKVISAG